MRVEEKYVVKENSVIMTNTATNVVTDALNATLKVNVKKVKLQKRVFVEKKNVLEADIVMKENVTRRNQFQVKTFLRLSHFFAELLNKC